MRQKLLLVTALVFGFALHLFAQFTPQGFNYQSVVRSPDGTALSNQTITLLFAIRSGAPNGPIAYAEKQTVSTNEFGLVNLIIGQGGQPQLGDFAAINWGGGAKYLSVAIETSPGAFDDLGATQLMSVPYALYAQTSANGGQGGGDDWGTQTVQTSAVLSGNGTSGNPLSIAQQGAQAGQTLKWDGSKWAPANDLNDNGFNGTVTQINTGSGLTGGPITSSGTIALSTTGVTPGIYGSATQIPVIQIDASGRVTDVFTVVPQPGTVNIDGGTGIMVQQNGFNFVLTNTGDVNAGDDVTIFSTASGDVSGTFSNLQINASAVGSTEIANNSVGNLDLADNAVSTSKIADGAVTAAKLDDMGASNGQVLKWNGAAWVASNDAQGITSVSITAGTGINVSGTSPNFTVTNTGDTNGADDLTTGSQANGDVTGPFSNLQIGAGVVGTAEIANGGVATADLADLAVTNAKIADNGVTTGKIANAAVTGAKIDNMNATNGQVLKWNGTTWAPAADEKGVTNIVQGNGIDVDVANGVYTIINTGDTDGSNDITIFSQADGDISGPFNNLQIKNGTVGSFEIMLNGVATNNIAPGAVTGAKIAQMGATNGKVLKWNGTTWAPADDLAGGGGGDNWGTQVVATNSTLSGTGINGNVLGIAQQGATNGQVLRWNGTTWAPASIPGDDWGAQTVQTGSALSGNGTAGAPLNLAQQGASTGEVLKWDGAKWAPGTDGGDNWGTQTVQKGNALSGNGTSGSPLNLAQQGASTGQVLKWDGAKWAPADDQTGGGGGGSSDVYSAGVGIDITGSSPNFVINNTGDLDETNEIQILGLAGNVLSLSNGGGSVNLPIANTYTAGTGISITGSAPNLTINNTGDADNNATNELQTLSLNGTTLKISQTNSTVKLDTILAGAGLNLWEAAGNNINNTNSANVGIGTTAPAVKLHVKGGSNEIVRVEGTNPMIGLSNGPGAPDAYLQHGATGVILGANDGSNITLRSSGSAGIVMDGMEGNVGIAGFPSATSRLTIYHEKGGLTLQNAGTGSNWTMGVSEFDGSLELYNSFSGSNPVGSFAINGVYTASDRRLKRDVLGLDKVLDRMMLLQPVSYHYNFENPDANRSIGFLAQDVQGLFPELVGHTNSLDGQQYLALNYAGFSVLTVKAIQEQQTQIETLQNENAALRQRTDELEARLSKLEQLLKKQ